MKLALLRENLVIFPCVCLEHIYAQNFQVTRFRFIEVVSL